MKKFIYGLLSFLLGGLVVVLMLNPGLLKEEIWANALSNLTQSPYFLFLAASLLCLFLILVIIMGIWIHTLREKITFQEGEIYELHLQIGELQKTKDK